MKYPYIENADEILSNICVHETNRKYEGTLRREALNQLDWELEAVRNQGAASAFLTMVDVLHAVKASNEDYVFRGTMAASVIAYAIGLTEIEPLEANPKLYPEFCYGIKGDRMPAFEMNANPDITNRLSAYFDAYPGKEPISRQFESDSGVFRTYIGEVADDEDEFPDTFHIVVVPIDEEGEEDLKLRLLSNPVCKICNPNDFTGFVKCFGLQNGSGTWEGNGEVLYKEGTPLKDLIGNREDVFEVLLEHDIDREHAYEIAEYVRKGKACSKGWKPEMIDIMNKAVIPEWFIGSCEKIKYLFPRSHSMMLIDHFCAI